VSAPLGSVRWAYGPAGVIRLIDRQVRGVTPPERRWCEFGGCQKRTRDHKPYCLDHVLLMPQVVEILRGR